MHDEEITYQWRTAKGAVVMELLEEVHARLWMQRMLKNDVTGHYARLKLFKVVKTTTLTEI
jgi:hypothetical protein